MDDEPMKTGLEEEKEDLEDEEIGETPDEDETTGNEEDGTRIIEQETTGNEEEVPT